MNLKSFFVFLALYWILPSSATCPDSINHNLQDYQYLTQFTEANLATFPYINEMYGKEYRKHKKAVVH